MLQKPEGQSHLFMRVSVMPMSFIQGIYDNPGSYVDRAHPEIRVVSVDTDAHSVTYASGGVTSSLRGYLGASLT